MMLLVLGGASNSAQPNEYMQMIPIGFATLGKPNV